mmetsp:Transcript_7904/g.13991  ORF Transcript_7904/g.13991 Transcript_7904/m.13991 type:complete len:522 (-) Transcript_7904:195-1760(-)
MSAEPAKEQEKVAADAAAEVAAAAAQDAQDAPEAVPDAREVRANELKGEANELFKQAHFEQAIAVYTEAIEAFPSAVLYANRAFAYLKSEAFGLAQQDASAAIKLDPSYVKGYYRLGSAHAALGHYGDARKVFRKVVALAPNNKEARLKYAQYTKEAKRKAFEEAIAMAEHVPASEAIDLSQILVPDSYDGPRMGDDNKVTLEFVEGLVEYQKEQKVVHKKYVASMLVQMRKMLDKMPSLIECQVPESKDGEDDQDEPFFTVCGDTHGQYYDLLNIFEVNGGRPSPKRPYLFNGDYVDRGSWSVETVLTLMAYKLLYPQHMHLLRGNHETINMNRIYGFEGEVKAKYDDKIMDLFTEVFQWLPLCATINKKVVIMHGGLFSKDGVKLDDIKAIPRGREPPDSGLMPEIMWSDPQPFPGRGESKRGIGLSFGPDITAAFLKDNDLDLLIRSHEVKDEGYLVEHDGKLITVFSAPNYCDQIGNKGALIRFKKDLKPEFEQFSAVPHPDIKPMAYAKNMGMFGL